MFTTIEDTLHWIHELLPHGIKPGTARMEWMLERAGNPERRIRAIHVGGTNGKGSTVSFLRNIYQEAGFKIGTFTSPYITSFNERIMVNGEPISDGDLISAANAVYPLVQELAATDLGEPTEFEVVTMISLIYFGKMNRCDLVIYEVGLGGRLDSTNVVYPLVTIITNVGMDHMRQLGNTIKSIAAEKAGIIKSGVGIITAAENPEALEVIRRMAKEKQADLYVLGKEFTAESRGHDRTSEHFSFHSFYIHQDDLRIHLMGEHQIKNAAAALMAVDYLQTYFSILVDVDQLKAGLEKTAWPGRFEVISETPLVVIDGAHNVQGTEALAQTVKRCYPDRKINVLYAALKDKQYDQMIRRIEAIAEEITFTTFDFPRAAESKSLYGVSRLEKKFIAEDWREAVKQLIARTKADEGLLITGSLYFISEVRRYLLAQKETLFARHS